MRKSTHELNEISPEFSENIAPEFVPLPDEFNRFPRQNKRTKDRSRLRKILLYLAAAGIVVFGVFSPNAAESSAVEPAPQAEATAETPIETPKPSASPAEAFTPAPTPAPTEEPSPTPNTTPIPTPGADVMYYYRSSLVYYAMLHISVPEQVSAVSFRLLDPNEEEPALEIELTPKQILDGTYQMRVGNRDEGFDANEYFATHPDADLTLELRYTVAGDAGEETHTETFEPDVEDWIYWRFDSEDDVGGIGEMMFGQVFPNCFVVRIYESTNPNLKIAVGDDPEALNNGDVAITVSIDGREIPEEGATPYSMMYRYSGDDTVYYDYALVIPLPEDFPPHGEATLTLTRKLIHSGSVFVHVKTVEY